MPDDNDRLRAGTLPADPEADTVPMAAPDRPPHPDLPPRLGELLPAAIARMHRRHTGTERPIVLPWPTMNAPLGGGLWPGVHVLVGATAAGKTQWCFQVAIAAAKAGHPVYYLALEADDVEFHARALGLEAGVQWGELYYGTHPHFDAITEAHAPALLNLPIHVDYAPSHGWHYQALPKTVQALRATYPDATPLVIIDYLQVIGTEGGEELRERIGRAAYVSRDVARTHNAAVILASSTARSNYEKARGDEKEALGAGWAGRFVGFGKESGEIEFAANNVIVITQEPWPSGGTPPLEGTICHLALAKVRALKPTWVELRFDGRAFTEPPRTTRLPGAPPR